MNLPLPNAYLKKSLFLLWISHLFVDFFTGIWPIYKTMAAIDVATAGLIAGVTGFMGESLQIFFGQLCDRGHRKKILIIGLVLASSIVWITFCSSIIGYFFVLLLLTLGSGAFHPAAAGLASSLSRSSKGKTILFFASGGSIGLAVSQLVFSSLLTSTGHILHLLMPLFAVASLVLFYRFPDIRSSRPMQSLRSVFSSNPHLRRPLSLLYISQVSNQAIVMSFMFLLPDVLSLRGCHSWFCFGGGHLCFILGAAFALIPAGFLCDRLGHRKVLITVLAFSICLLYLFLFQPALSSLSAILLLLTLGAFVGTINPIIISWGNHLVPDSPSTISAFLMGFAWCIGNLGPMLAGFIVKGLGGAYIPALCIMGISFFICLGCVLKIERQISLSTETETE
ncbi:MAG: MFS transporter [Verrucomicrobia bacterium]|nr:MFS transporter [Verrucomicrobiota bacterium]